MSVVCGVAAFVVVGSLAAVLLLLGLTAFFGQFYIGIGNSLIATHAPDADRAGTISIFSIGYNLLAYGLGPTLVGVISDTVEPLAGAHSVGWGLAATLLFSLAGAYHFARARSALKNGEGRAPEPFAQIGFGVVDGDINALS